MRRSRSLLKVVVSIAVALSALGAAQTEFSDVPGTHWAKPAVDAITACGLIVGFPDGTFRGNQNLTRYQAALIFFRYLQNPAACNLSEGDQATVNAGIDEVRNEIQLLIDMYNELQANVIGQEARIAALEAAAGGGTASASLEARLAALEKATATSNTGAYSLSAGTSLESRVAALESQISGLSSKQAASDAKVASLQGQIDAMQKQISDLTLKVTGMPSTVIVPSTPVTPITPSTTVPAIPTLGAAAAPSKVYFGIGAYYPFSPLTSDNISADYLDVSGIVGVNNLLGPVGLRAGVDFNPSVGLHEVSTYLMAGQSAYAGIGLRYVLTALDPGFESDGVLYGSSVLGFSTQGKMGFFLEAQPRFGDNLAFAFGVRTGLRFAF